MYTYKLKAPCTACPRSDRTSYTCLKCEARLAYNKACNGDSEAIAFLNGLDYSTLGKEIATPATNWRTKNTKTHEWYEKKYADLYRRKRLEYPGQSRFNSFRGMLRYVYKINKTLNATAKELGICNNTMICMLDAFSIPRINQKIKNKK